MTLKRRKLVNKIPDYLITSMERLAKLKNWDVDLVHEEAIIHYLNSEHIRMPYTGDMKKQMIPAAKIAKSVAPKVRKMAATAKVAKANITKNVKNTTKEFKGAIASNKKANGGKFRPLSMKGIYRTK